MGHCFNHEDLCQAKISEFEKKVLMVKLFVYNMNPGCESFMGKNKFPYVQLN